MSLQKNQLSSEIQNLCKDCNTFFACQAFNGYCSTCFRNHQSQLNIDEKEKTQTQVKTKISKVQFIREVDGKDEVFEKKCQMEQKDKKKCFTCSKKVGLLGIECKCCFVFCNSHRLPEDHECKFNHKEQAKKRLQAQLIKVQNHKVGQI